MKDLYRRRNLPLPPEYGEGMTTLFFGLKRLEAERDQSGDARESGKRPLTYSRYVMLCKSTLAQDDGGFAHLFLATQWSLMCRSKSVETIQTSLLVCADDSVGIVLHKIKTNREGSRPKAPRHLYANPGSPVTCWLTALAFYLACHPHLQPGALFLGSNQKLRFGKALAQCLKCDSDAQRRNSTVHIQFARTWLHSHQVAPLVGLPY
ncbi:hypothetical protein PC129_g21524 [Phytophthora cactorum]|uniref:Uncharacterized protein n=1 Tax=Phytophthora cactorum TaxID=29920 RepID=A0A8T1K067_9STRA|nr:hypothetical protein Pcac1_g1229 [Phytophthora cactorum]KAG2961271.1 hypothetical protein PC118_g22061 [Phytophthora cactorum]KAG2968334.1 hypothetical protein PC119_g24246 [Phytophthora cactorum]KAG3207124.1 hypothetical protein PC129_g21524 [Phytophthora cactorum]KAG4038390.1 hypothetical protein PC123_g26047 [Phytophthora cactorum]